MTYQKRQDFSVKVVVDFDHGPKHLGATRADGRHSPTAIPAIAKQDYVGIILDPPGGMDEAAENSTKPGIARERLSSYLVAIGNDNPLGLRVYSGQPLPRDQSCKDSRLTVPIMEEGPMKVRAAVARLRASGDTPIAFGLSEAAKDFTADPERISTNLLTSDGEETGDGDPVAVVNDLQANGLDMLNIIGIFADGAGSSVRICLVVRSGSGRFPLPRYTRWCRDQRSDSSVANPGRVERGPRVGHRWGSVDSWLLHHSSVRQRATARLQFSDHYERSVTESPWALLTAF